MSPFIDEQSHGGEDAKKRGLDLIAFISDEFGTLGTTVRNQLLAATIEIDGVEYTGKDKTRIPYRLAAGKEIVVIGPDRQWKFTYSG